MSLSTVGLVSSNPGRLGGDHRIYKFGDVAISFINTPIAHNFPYAWESYASNEDRIRIHMSDEDANCYLASFRN